MYQAAIVEDQAEIRTYLRDSLAHCFNEKKLPMTFDTFESGDAFLQMYEKHFHFDVIFLDIEMPKMDGITLCKRIRELTPDALVVFISNKEELVFQTFEVQPFRFIRKSEYDKQLPALTDAIVDRLGKNSSSIMRITESSSGDIFSFDIQKIFYIEAQRKNCRIVSETGELTLQYKLMDLEEKLADYHFIKPHRSYLVNSRCIYYIGRASLTLCNNEEIPISRVKVDEVKQLFLEYTTK
mgnify:CR=1 FL=1